MEPDPIYIIPPGDGHGEILMVRQAKRRRYECALRWLPCEISGNTVSLVTPEFPADLDAESAEEYWRPEDGNYYVPELLISADRHLYGQGGPPTSDSDWLSNRNNYLLTLHRSQNIGVSHWVYIYSPSIPAGLPVPDPHKWGGGATTTIPDPDSRTLIGTDELTGFVYINGQIYRDNSPWDYPNAIHHPAGDGFKVWGYGGWDYYHGEIREQGEVFTQGRWTPYINYWQSLENMGTYRLEHPETWRNIRVWALWLIQYWEWEYAYNVYSRLTPKFAGIAPIAGALLLLGAASMMLGGGSVPGRTPKK